MKKRQSPAPSPQRGPQSSTGGLASESNSLLQSLLAQRSGANGADASVKRGTGRAESHDAAALTVGQDVHISEAAFELGSLDPVAFGDLMLHESIHVAQNQLGSGGVLGAAEAEADALGPTDPVRSAGAGVMAKGFSEWFPTVAEAAKSLWEGTDEALEKKEIGIDWEGKVSDADLTSQPPHDPHSPDAAKKPLPSVVPAFRDNDGVFEELDTYIGTDTPVQGERGGVSFSPKSGSAVSTHTDDDSGDKTIRFDHYASHDNGAGNEVVTNQFASDTFDAKGKQVSSSSGKSIEVDDPEQTAKAAAAKLQVAKGPVQTRLGQNRPKLDALRSELRDKGSRIDRLKREQLAPPAEGEEGPDHTAEIKRLEGEHLRLGYQADELAAQVDKDDQMLAQLDADKQRLLGDPTAMASVAARYQGHPDVPLTFEKKTKKAESSTTVDKGGVEVNLKERKVEVQGDKTIHRVDDGKVERVHEEHLGGHFGLENGGAAGQFGKNRSSSRTQKKDPNDPMAEFDPVKKDERSSFTGAKGKFDKDGWELGGAKEVNEKRADRSEKTKSDALTIGSDGLKATSSRSKKDAAGKSRGTDQEVTVNTEGASAKRDDSWGKEGEHFKGEVKTSVDGAFTVRVVPDKASGQYKLITSINVGGSVGAEGGAGSQSNKPSADNWKKGDGKATAGAQVKITGKAAYTHTRLLPEAEAEQYLAGVDQIPDSSGQYPEFSVWSRLKLLADKGAGTEELAGVVGDSNAAQDMNEGDSFELELGAGGEVGADASVEDGVGVGVGGRLEGEVSRKLSVKRGKGDLVIVSLTFSQSTGKSGTLSGSAGVAQGSAEFGSKSGDSYGVSFNLDRSWPDYDAYYGRIVSTFTRDSLQALKTEVQGRHAKAIGGETKGESEDNSRKGNAAIGPVALNVGDSNRRNEVVTLGEDGNSGTFEGASSADAHIEAFGLKLGTKTEEKGVADVDDNGMTITLEETRDDSSLGLPDGDDADKALEERDVTKLVQEIEATITGTTIRNAELPTLNARAGNKSKWMGCVSWIGGGGLVDTWAGLRSAILSSQPDPDWADVDPALAKRLTQARAWSRFFQAAGGNAQAALTNLRLHYGEESGGADAAGAFGLGYQWPSSIAEHKSKYDAVMGKLEGIDRTQAGFLEAEDGMAKEVALVTDLEGKIMTCRNAIAGCADFEDGGRRQAEMLRYLTEAKRILDAKHRAFVEAYNAKHGTELDENAWDHVEIERAKRRVNELHTILKGLKAAEGRSLAIAAKADTNEKFGVLSELDRSYRFWAGQVRDTLEAYDAAADHCPPRLVNADAMNADLEPNFGRFEQIWLDSAHFVADEKSKIAGIVGRYKRNRS